MLIGMPSQPFLRQSRRANQFRTDLFRSREDQLQPGRRSAKRWAGWEFMTTSGRLAITTLGYFDLEPRVLERLNNILEAGNQIVTNEQPLRHAGASRLACHFGARCLL